jgi:tetrahydromethanopterin S-methyltransferase subunit G
LVNEDEFKVLENRVEELERLFEELHQQMTPDKIGKLVEKYVKEYAKLQEGARS